MNDFAITTHALTRQFGDVLAVNNMDIQVPRGHVFGFLGPNGAGKTTTIRMLLGLIEPTSGHAEVLGFDTRTQGEKIRRNCGALLEHNGLYEKLSAIDNLEFYGRAWKIPASERRQRIQFLLEHLGLWERRSDLVGNWSRGMKQKLAIARTLLHRPELVFLDEPTAGLDPIAAAALRDDLAALVEQEGVTIFLTTHNLSEAEKLCHQVGVIRAGTLLATGDLERMRQNGSAPLLQVHGANFTDTVLNELRSLPQVSAVTAVNGRLDIRLSGPQSAHPLISWLVQAGVEIEEVHRSSASLEQVFLALVNEGEG